MALAVFSAGCALNRADVKSLRDRDANRIQLDAVIHTTVTALNGIHSQCRPAFDHRVRAEESRVYQVVGRITRVKREREQVSEHALSQPMVGHKMGTMDHQMGEEMIWSCGGGSAYHGHMAEITTPTADHRLARHLLRIALMASLAVTAAQYLKAARNADKVTIVRVPHGGIQPQVAVDETGTLHLIYFGGDPSHGDLYYVHSADSGASFSDPVRINHEPGSAIAVGNVRGARLAVGPNGRIHVTWNGTRTLGPEPANPDAARLPMLYTRTNDAGTAFESERNVIQSSFGIDGGGAVAADRSGRVYVFWHAPTPGLKGEDNRRVWMARSSDEGKTFDRERPAFEQPTGACGCCGMGALADRRGNLYVLFRSATEMVHRDIYLLTSADGGNRFQGANIAPWNVGACVMSTESFAESPAGVLAAWEQTGQVYYGVINPQTHMMSSSIPAPEQGTMRKHPVVVGDRNGDILLAWTEGMAWQKGGSLGWQVFDASGHAQGSVRHASDVPVWSLIAAFARPDGGFTIIY